jgi:hypothetical protein
MAKRKFVCCICEDAIEGEYGNNPSPFVGDKCCDLCNDICVTPVRGLMATAFYDVKEMPLEERTKLRADIARERAELIKRRGPWTPGVIQGGVQ